MVVFETLVFALVCTGRLFAEWVDDMACDVEKIMGVR
jgi:hypothetical protein